MSNDFSIGALVWYVDTNDCPYQSLGRIVTATATDDGVPHYFVQPSYKDDNGNVCSCSIGLHWIPASHIYKNEAEAERHAARIRDECHESESAKHD